MNNNLYAEVYKLCKFMKRIAKYQERKNLPRVRLSFNSSEFPIPNIERREQEKLYNFKVAKNLDNIYIAFCKGYKHFRPKSIGKPDDAIKIEFFLKQSDKDKIIIDKSKLLNNKEIIIYICVKRNEFNYTSDIRMFICKFISKNFHQLNTKKDEEEYKKIVKRESYTQEELLELYPLPELDD